MTFFCRGCNKEFESSEEFPSAYVEIINGIKYFHPKEDCDSVGNQYES